MISEANGKHHLFTTQVCCESLNLKNVLYFKETTESKGHINKTDPEMELRDWIVLFSAALADYKIQHSLTK